MFEEQYRRDNDRLHAREELLMEIKKKAAASEPPKARRVFMRYGAIAAALLLVIGGTAGILLHGGNGGQSAAPMALSAEQATDTRAAETSDGMVVLNDYDDLYSLLMETRNAYMRGVSMNETSGSDMLFEAVPTDEPAAEEAAMDAAGDNVIAAAPMAEMNGAGGEDYTETNVQVKGVDEADIIKTDGQYIYYLTGEELIIARADGENTRILSRTAYAAADAFSAAYYGAQEMFLQNGCVAILASGSASVLTKDRQFYQDQTSVLLYDVSNPARPKLKKTLGQSGYYLSSRMVDGVLYLVTTQYVWNVMEGVPVSFAPSTWRDGSYETVAVSNIYVPDRGLTDCYTIVSSIDMQQADAIDEVKAVLGNGGSIYCSGDRMLLAASDWTSETSDIAPDETGKNVQITKSGSRTSLVLFSLDKGRIEKLADCTLNGQLLNQFSMDEYEGVFRIVTTVDNYTEKIYTDGIDTYEYEDERYNCLYTLSASLEPLGALENLAKDEEVKSVRFDGDIAYFVTFRQTDPLFTVDLSDPAKPAVMSTLKIPGFSSYLHVYADGRLLGVGYDADENTGWQQGVKLTMFDTSDKADVKELTTKLLKADWTPVGYNHKSILVDAKRNIIAFPADDCYYVFSYDEATGFTQEGKLASGSGGWGENLRGLFIGDMLYICSSTRLTVISLPGFTEVKTLEFAAG